MPESASRIRELAFLAVFLDLEEEDEQPHEQLKRDEQNKQTSREKAGRRKGGVMLYWALVFFVVAVIAAVLGFGGIAGIAATIAKWLFVLFLVVFAVMLIMWLVQRGKKAAS